MDKPSTKTDIFQGLLVDKFERGPNETTWQSIEKRIRTSAADPKDIEDWVVIVDDSPTSLLIIANILKSLCIGVHPFISATSALDYLKATDDKDLKKIMAIFSDIEMPVMNGVQFLKELRATERLSKMPFVFTSSHGDRKVIKEAAVHGLQGYIVKPLTSESVVERVMAINVEAQKRATG